MKGRTAPDRLLATDLDGTVIPPEWNDARAREIAEFARLASEQADILLAYVTGRQLAPALRGVREYVLPEPDVLACDVGTSIYRRSADGTYEKDASYEARMRRAFGDHEGRDVEAALLGIAHLVSQEEEKQGRFKVSFYIDARRAHPPVLDRVRSRLSATGAEANVIYSVDPATGTGLLDVLPAGISKETAVVYLQEELGLTRDKVVYAGDSGNDIAALVSGFKAIVVGNASESVKAEVRREAEKAGVLSRLYIAEHSFASGVVEGCRHFGFF